MKKKLQSKVWQNITFATTATIILSACGTGTVGGNDAPIPTPTPTVTPTPTPTPTPTTLSGIIFGNNAGLLYVNNQLQKGNSQTYSIDANPISGVVVINNTTYAGTSGGKVYQYNESSQMWVNLPGNGAGYTLDSTSIDILAQNNNVMYAATGGGSLFKYVGNKWNRISSNVNNTINALTFDSNNAPYIGTGNGQVFKYNNGVWENLTTTDGSVDGNNTQINALAIYDNGLYAATNTNGQVYKYDGSKWNSTSSFTVEAINTLAVFNNKLYAGTNAGNNVGNIQEYDGTNWTEHNSPDDTPVNVLLESNNALYAATAGGSDPHPNGQVYSYDGSTWTQISSLSNGPISAMNVVGNSVYAGTINPNLSSFNLNTLYKFTTGMSQWTPVNGVNSIDNSSIIFSTAIDQNKNMYVGTLFNVYKFNTTLQSWLPIAITDGSDNSGVSSIAIYNNTTYSTTFACNVYSNYNSNDWVKMIQIPDCFNSSLYSTIDKNTGDLYIGVNTLNLGDASTGVVWKYSNQDSTWKLLRGTGAYDSLDSSTIQSVTTDSLGNLYAGTGLGLIWKYPVGGTAWTLVGTGTPDTGQVMTITTDTNNNLYIGTNQGNVFTYNGIAWVQLGFAPLDGSTINTVLFDSSGILYATTGGGNVWQYSPTNNLWINQYYGNGILLGSNTTPTASAF